jgi:hypothetical protein
MGSHVLLDSPRSWAFSTHRMLYIIVMHDALFAKRISSAML